MKQKQLICALVLIASAFAFSGESQAWPRGSSGGHSRSSWAGSYRTGTSGLWHGGTNHNSGWAGAGRANFGRGR